MYEKTDAKKKSFVKRRIGRFAPKKCKFCMEKIEFIDYKDIALLKKFITASGKILGSRITGNCVRHQLLLSRAIKRARFLGLLPYTVT